MNITTKFNIGDKVWTKTNSPIFIDGQFIDAFILLEIPLTIIKIEIVVTNAVEGIMYGFKESSEMRIESEIFSSKEELQRYCYEFNSKVSNKG